MAPRYLAIPSWCAPQTSAHSAMKTEWDIPHPTGGAEGNTGESGREGR